MSKKLANAFSSYQEEMVAAEIQFKAEIKANAARTAREAKFEAEQKEKIRRAVATKGRTINGATPKRSSSKAARYEAVRFQFTTVKDALIHLFVNTPYASGDAALVIKAMGENLAGNHAVAQKTFASQGKYRPGKSMVRWATEELRCIGIIERPDLVEKMTVGLL